MSVIIKIVYEMFHAFQRKNGEIRHTNNFLILNYPNSIENYELKFEENLCLAKAYRSNDFQEKKELIDEFMAIRLYRQGLIGEIIKQEYNTETHEGMAEYIGAMAWNQLSEELFSEKTEEYCERIEALDESFFDIRRSHYFTGAIFACVLDELGFSLWHEINGAKETVFEMASQGISPKKPTKLSDKTFGLKEVFCKHMDEKRAKFQAVIEKSNEITEGDFYIDDYDPMSKLRLDNMIFCREYVTLISDAFEKPVFIDGLLILYLEKNSINHVLAYQV